MIVEFFSSEKIRVDTEFQVFQAALRWITRDINDRRQYVFEVLQHVRLPLLSLGMKMKESGVVWIRKFLARKPKFVEKKNACHVTLKFDS